MIRNTITAGTAAAALAAGALLCATSAYADTDPNIVGDYAISNGRAFCATLTAYPSAGGVAAVADHITSAGFTNTEAGRILAFSVVVYCPSIESRIGAVLDSF